MATQVTSPAPSSAPPPAAPSSGSIYSRLSEATSGVADRFKEPEPSVEPSQAAEPVTEAQPPVGGAEPAQPAGETSVKADTTAPPQVEPNPYEVDDTVPDESALQGVPGMDAFLKHPKGQEIYRGYKAYQELSKPLDQGGIGHVPTLEQSRDYFLAFRDRRMMDADLSSGNPQQISRYLGYVFDPQRGERNVAVASQLAPSLAQQPELYAAAMEPFLNHYLESLMGRLKETRGYRENTQDEVADALWFAATVINKDLNGEYLQPLQNGKGQPATPAADPLADQRREIEEQRAELERQRGQSVGYQQQAWSNAYRQQTQDMLYAELDRALEPLKRMHGSAPNLYSAARRQFHDEVVRAVSANVPAMELFNVSAQEAIRAGNTDSAQGLARQYLNMAIPAIRAARKKFLEGAGVTAQRMNDARHSELATIDANRSAGNGAGAGPQPGATPALTKGKDESQVDFIQRMVKAATAGTAARLQR